VTAEDSAVDGEVGLQIFYFEERHAGLMIED